jgi:hypothetical protein
MIKKYWVPFKPIAAALNKNYGFLAGYLAFQPFTGRLTLTIAPALLPEGCCSF